MDSTLSEKIREAIDGLNAREEREVKPRFFLDSGKIKRLEELGFYVKADKADDCGMYVINKLEYNGDDFESKLFLARFNSMFEHD